MTSIAVSYTHLDVYKRQAFTVSFREPKEIYPIAFTSPATVVIMTEVLFVTLASSVVISIFSPSLSSCCTPKDVYKRQAYGPRTHGIRSKGKLDEIVEKSLRDAAIWDEVKDRLKSSALGMSGGQQQRLCIARALAVQPEVLLMDEPTSALDPISTTKIEDLAVQLKKDYTIIMVTHNMQQAARISDKTAFFLLGEVVEFHDTHQIFSMPKDKRTEDYITGRFG